ncbi:hypothetical protein [Sporosarcina sp. P20a]|uniref:hypothetical protein n=1 Tax=Sporosarcina sp. P20a TaxID=2048256 RepID=UPI001E50AB91|nr:hypothetical protein [Sporosarcina sp. P20a]
MTETPSSFAAFDSWIGRRLRISMWKKWKEPVTKFVELLLELPRDQKFSISL